LSGIWYNRQDGPNVLLARPARDQTYDGGLSLWRNLISTSAGRAIKTSPFARIPKESNCSTGDIGALLVVLFGGGRFLPVLDGNESLRPQLFVPRLVLLLRGVLTHLKAYQREGRRGTGAFLRRLKLKQKSARARRESPALSAESLHASEDRFITTGRAASQPSELSYARALSILNGGGWFLSVISLSAKSALIKAI